MQLRQKYYIKYNFKEAFCMYTITTNAYYKKYYFKKAFCIYIDIIRAYCIERALQELKASCVYIVKKGFAQNIALKEHFTTNKSIQYIEYSF